LFWKVFSATHKDGRINHRGWKLYLRTSEIDVNSGIREGVLIPADEVARIKEAQANRSIGSKLLDIPKGLWESIFAP
jgi:hypothetical protein